MLIARLVTMLVSIFAGTSRAAKASPTPTAPDNAQCRTYSRVADAPSPEDSATLAAQADAPDRRSFLMTARLARAVFVSSRPESLLRARIQRFSQETTRRVGSIPA